MAGLGVDFFPGNIIYFCAILNVFVDCCFSFCLFFFNGAVRRENKMKDILRGAGVETIIFRSGIM